MIELNNTQEAIACEVLDNLTELEYPQRKNVLELNIDIDGEMYPVCVQFLCDCLEDAGRAQCQEDVFDEWVAEYVTDITSTKELDTDAIKDNVNRIICKIYDEKCEELSNYTSLFN